MRVVGEVILRPCVEVCEIAAATAGDENFFSDSMVVLEHKHGAIP